MRITLRLAVAMVAATLSGYAQAEWTKHYEVQYILGDGDSRTSARQAALQAIRDRAAGEAGTYIQTTTTLSDDGKLSRSVQAVTASLIQVTNPEEHLSINPAGAVVLHLQADVHLDDAELAHRISVMQHDRQKEAAIAQLEEENTALHIQLNEIRAQLGGHPEPAAAGRLIALQDATVRRLNKNGDSVTEIFQRGTLVELAQTNDRDFARAMEYIDHNVYDVIMRAHPTARIESVERDKNGYIARVRVGWKVDVAGIEKALEPYISGSSVIDGTLDMPAYENRNGRGKDVQSRKVFDYLATHGVALEVGIGRQHVEIPVLYADAAFMGACQGRAHLGDISATHVCLSVLDANAKDVHGYWGPNPIELRLTTGQAEQATSVEAHFIRVDTSSPDGK